MRLSKLFSFITVALLVVVLFVGLVPVPAAAATDTMQFRYNATHSGDFSPVAGSIAPNNQQKWSPFVTGQVSSSPAVANGVVYVGSEDHKVYAIDAATGTAKWSQPFVTGGRVSSSPAVANGVVYVGSYDTKVYAIGNQPAAPIHWEPLGGILTASPAAVSWGNGRIDIFARGGEGHTWHTWWQNGWGTWEDVGGPLLPDTGPAVSSWASGRLDLFVIGTDNALWHKYWQNGWGP